MEDRSDPLALPALAWRDRVEADIVIVGAGIAGLTFALRLSERLRVIVVTKGALGESNTRYAQGGLAAAVGTDDHPDLHYADTISAGAGLCDEDAVRILVAGGPEAVRWLLDRGTNFDIDDDTLALGREAAHSRNRVLHAGGDATGAEIERALVAQIRSRERITILEHTAAIDLVVSDDGSCNGVIVQTDGNPECTMVSAATTVLANGGAGQLWAVTSNPPGATGDGIAVALRAGVDVADLEFTQFHPTVLAGADLEPFLISEAVRGEGAYLRSAAGERFMPAEHPSAELAPRDVVARAIQRQMAADANNPVYLDLRHLEPDLVQQRFPTITKRLESDGFDLATDLIPVAPAAHYFMGGIVADTWGETSMPGLLALGEVSCTGIHGANRLASNSLLEGLVFGLRAADRINESIMEKDHSTVPVQRGSTRSAGPVDDDQRLRAIKRTIQQIMSADAAVVRSAASLEHALDQLALIEENRSQSVGSWPASELRNMVLLAREVVVSAIGREESRGSHFRQDFPERRQDLNHRHQVVRLRSDGFARTFRPLHPAFDVIGTGQAACDGRAHRRHTSEQE